MLERFYPKHIFAKIGSSEEEFWESRSLNPGDWAGLAGLLYSEIFSLDILTPLDHTDTTFKLELHPQADLSRYAEMVHNIQLGSGGPDLLGNVYTPRGNIHINSPYLEVSTFNPRSKMLATEKKIDKKELRSLVSSSLSSKSQIQMPWKKTHSPYLPDKVTIPLPIPHPAHIACTIYNRDSDDPIPLESEICQSILKGIEESYGTLEESHIGRYRGGGETLETLSSSSEMGVSKLELDDSNVVNITSTEGVYHWTLNNWGQRKRNNSGSVRVDLASPEDVTLDSDSTKVVFNAYGTTV